MSAVLNPFMPTTGAESPELIGCSEIISDFVNGLWGGVGAPSRLMRVVGPVIASKNVV